MEKQAAKKGGVFKGWYIIIATMVMAMCGGACTNGTYYNVNIMVNEGLIDSTVPGMCSSIVSLCSVLFATVMGIFMKKKGLKITALFAFLVGAIAFLAMIFLPPMSVIVMLSYFGFGFCMSTVTKLVSPNIVNTWFEHNRALPMALVIAGPAAVTIFSGIQGSLVTKYGWRAGWIWGLLFVAVGFVLAFFCARDDIHQIGEVRDGRAWREKHGISLDDSGVVAGEEKKESVGAAGLLKNIKFWLFGVSCLIRMGSFAGCQVYITLIILSRGFSKVEAAAAIASITLASTVGRLATPLVSKVFRLSNTGCNILAHLIMAGGCIGIFFCSSLLSFTITTLLIGFAYRLGFVSQTLALADLFPSYDFSSILGVFTTIVNCSFIFPTLVGVVGKALGQDYTPIYVVLGVINIALAVLVFTMRPKQSKEQTA